MAVPFFMGHDSILAIMGIPVSNIQSSLLNSAPFYGMEFDAKGENL